MFKIFCIHLSQTPSTLRPYRFAYNAYAIVLRLVGLVSRSSVSLLLGLSAMLRVSLVSRVTARSLHDKSIICLGVYRHLVSGHEIGRLQHCLECYTRIMRSRQCCNQYIIRSGNCQVWLLSEQRTQCNPARQWRWRDSCGNVALFHFYDASPATIKLI